MRSIPGIPAQKSFWLILPHPPPPPSSPVRKPRPVVLTGRRPFFLIRGPSAQPSSPKRVSSGTDDLLEKELDKLASIIGKWSRISPPPLPSLPWVTTSIHNFPPNVRVFHEKKKSSEGCVCLFDSLAWPRYPSAQARGASSSLFILHHLLKVAVACPRPQPTLDSIAHTNQKREDGPCFRCDEVHSSYAEEKLFHPLP